jgi:hypothetical protein
LAAARNKLTRRDFVKVAGAVTVTWPTLAGRTRASEGKRGFCFFVMADPQLFWGSKANWDQAIGCANALKPDFVMVCGDMVNHAGNEEEVKAYLDGAARLDKAIGLYHVCGNHDYDVARPESLGWYQSRFGHPWYSFTHKRCLFVVFESTMIKYGAEDQPQYQWQMRWLEQTLLAGRGKGYDHIIVCTHYPLALRKADEADEYFNLPQSRRMRLLELFHRCDVTAVFSGHFHHNAYVKDGDLELITTSSTGIALEQMGEPKDPLGFRIVKVYPDRIEHEYHGYAALPQTLAL